VAIYDRRGEAISAGKRKCPRLDVKEAAQIASVHTLCEKFVSKAQIQSETLGGLPIVLYEPAAICRALTSPVEHGVTVRGLGRRVSIEEIRVGQSGARST